MREIKMRFFQKKEVNHEKFIGLSISEARKFAEVIPEDIKRFMNEQVYEIMRSEGYPEYKFFMKLKDPKVLEAAVGISNLVNRVGTLKDSEDLLKNSGFPADYFLWVKHFRKINEASAVWICLLCEKVIGLLDPVPADLISKYPDLADPGNLNIYFYLYALAEKLVCPNCSGKHYLVQHPSFLLSGLKLKDYINALKRYHSKNSI